MMYYACIGVLWVSLTACLGQSLFKGLSLQPQGTDVSSNCQEALVACVIPVLLPYASASNPSEVLEIARNIRLGEHCRKTRKTFTCLRGLIGKGQCSDVDPTFARGWKLIDEGILGGSWTYICRTEFKKFSIHYPCLLTDEVFIGIGEACSSMKGSSEGVDCVGRVIKEQCGSTAYEITKTLLESAVKRGEEIMKEMKGEESEDDDDDEQEQQSTLPENAYARQLNIFKKLLKKK